MSTAMEKFFKKQQERSRGRQFGDRIEFFRKPKKNEKPMTLVGRFIPIKDDEGDIIPAWEYRQHGWGKTSHVCPTTFDSDAYCETCEESRMAYQADDKDTGRELLAKASYWFCFVPRMSQFEEKPFILELPYSFTQRLWLTCALKGGWQSSELDLEDEDCQAALFAGVEKCFGEEGYDFSFTYNPNAQGKNKYSKEKFSQRPAKKITLEWEEVPNFEDLFRRIKKLNDDGGPKSTEPSAPPPNFDKMTKKELMEYADRVGIEYTKSWKVAKMRKHIKESVE